jgi:glycosyltransferase involved in cell wall biosynthesis
VIPCFNLGQFLGEAIDSVLQQTFQDFEIIVVDDGSTDDMTRRELEALAASKTRVIRSVNRGLSAARNLGMSHASGEYISALDADDRFEPTWLERGVELLDDQADVAFASHWLRSFGDEESEWKPVRCDLAILLDYNVMNGAALFRRSLVDQIGGFDESMREGCEDWEFWIRALAAGHRGAILPHVLYEYRRRPDSMSRTMNRGETHMRLYTSLVTRHPAQYSEHLLDLVLRRDWTFARLIRQIDAVREDLTRSLEPALEERRRELERAKERLAAVRERRRLECRLQELEAESDAANRLVRDVLQSRSWRLTSPLRRACERLGLAPRAPYDE